MVSNLQARTVSSPKIIDLFCGCGGFSLGAARAGFDVVAGIDFDERPLKTHERNFRSSAHLKLDLSSTTGAQVLEEIDLKAGDITGIIGGPPCQGFSSMGSNNKSDPRNRLFQRFFEIVDELRPAFFVCENVPGLLRPNFKDIREEALKIVSPNYNVIGPLKLVASDYGAPTTRTRAFFIGTLKSSDVSFIEEDFFPSGAITTTVGEALSGLPITIRDSWQKEKQGWRKVRQSNSSRLFAEHLKGKIPTGVGDEESIERLSKENRVSGCLGTVHLPTVIDRFSSVAEGSIDNVSRAPRLNRKGFCPTLRAGTGTERGSYQAVRPIHPTQNRVITPREAARLQGFPDWFRFDSTKWHSFRQIGNSVSPILADYVLSKIFATLASRA